MADVHNKETRSKNMAAIKSKNTKPEMLVRRFLHAKGFRYRLHVKNLPGKPDIVLPKYKTVIFVHGCFWHGHEGCNKAELPKTRVEWWKNKIAGNMNHDCHICEILREQGWRVAEVWTCQLSSQSIKKTLQHLHHSIKGG